MKKYFAFFASAALMMAACAKEEVNTPVDSPVAGETELITVELNPGTKTSLNGKVTNWTAGDAVSVTANGTSLGNLEFNDQTGKFSGKLSSAALEGAQAVVLNYPAGVTEVPATQAAVADNFSTSNGNPTALLEGTTTMAVLRAGNGAELSNKTALLKFSVAQAGTVTFEVGSTKYTVTGCQTGKTYYACVAPTTASFTARIDGYLSKKAANNVVFEANDVKNLGELPAPVASTKYGLAGTMQTNAWKETDPMVMYNDINNTVLIKNVQFFKDDEFKVVVDKSWNESYGTNGSNYKVAEYGTYDVTFNTSTKKITCTKVSDELTRTVRFTFVLDTNNNKQWFTAANMYVWGNSVGEVFGKYPGKAMTKNDNTLYCDLPGKCVGQTINYKIGNPAGDWTTGDRSVAVTYEGVRINASTVGIE